MNFRIFIDGNEVYSTDSKDNIEAVLAYVDDVKDQKYRLVHGCYDCVNQEKIWYFETR